MGLLKKSLIENFIFCAVKLVEEPKYISRVISPVILAEIVVGKKRLTFNLSYANKHICT